MKKWLSCLMVLCMVLSMLPVTAYAEAVRTNRGIYEESDETVLPEEDAAGKPILPVTDEPDMTIEPITAFYVNPLYADAITEADLKRPEAAVNNTGEYYATLEAAAEDVREQMTNRTETVVVNLTQDSWDSQLGKRILEMALTHTGVPTEGDYLGKQFGGCQIQLSGYSSGGIYYPTVTYTVTYYTTAAQEAEMDAAVSALLDELDLYSKSDYEKVKGIYDYICSTVTYDYEHLEDTSYYLKYTAYAALINKTAVCQGYATLLYRLALELGVDCRYISGIGGGGAHGWNIIKLHGLYYNVDATWDAVYYETYGSYEYFLTSDANFADHTRKDEYATEKFYADYPMGTENYDPAQTPAVTDSGECGENLKWVLTDDGILTISGTGAMSDFEYDYAAPWDAYKDQIINVIVEAGVTNVGSWAFAGCTALTSVSLPAGITVIGDCAFDGCTALEEITIPEAVTAIGDSAFYRCSSLKSITIPDSVLSIGACAFFQCTALESVDLGSSVQNIGYVAFSGCSSLASITIPGSVVRLDYMAFGDCDSLASVTIHGNGLAMDGQTFSNCTNLTTVTITGKIESLGYSTFEGCTNLTNITLTDDIMSIDMDVFANTGYYNNEENWKDGVLYVGNHLIKAKADVVSGNYTVKEGTICVANDAFNGCEGLTGITIPEGVKSIGLWAFGNCTNLASISLPDSIERIGFEVFSGTSYYENEDNWTEGVLYINHCLIKANSEAVSGDYVIRPDTVCVANGAFSCCEGMTSVVIPEGITYLDNSMFANCTGMTSVRIPGSVTAMGAYVFENCSSLESVIIPESVTYIGRGAFFLCTNLTSVVFQGDAPRFDGDPKNPKEMMTFMEVTANAYYPAGNATWTEDTKLGYGGNLTWIAMSEILEGTDSVVTADDEKLVIHVDHEVENFVSVYVDGVMVDAVFYTVTEGSTIITFTAEFLSTLEAGEHTVTVFFTDGAAVTGFTIEDAIPGDVNGDGEVDGDDVVYLLYHTLFGDDVYPITQDCDYNDDGIVDGDDAIYLLYHTLFGNDIYPL